MARCCLERRTCRYSRVSDENGHVFGFIFAWDNIRQWLHEHVSVYLSKQTRRIVKTVVLTSLTRCAVTLFCICIAAAAAAEAAPANECIHQNFAAESITLSSALLIMISDRRPCVTSFSASSRTHWKTDLIVSHYIFFLSTFLSSSGNSNTANAVWMWRTRPNGDHSSPNSGKKQGFRAINNRFARSFCFFLLPVLTQSSSSCQLCSESSGLRVTFYIRFNFLLSFSQTHRSLLATLERSSFLAVSLFFWLLLLIRLQLYAKLDSLLSWAVVFFFTLLRWLCFRLNANQDRQI